LQDVIFKVCDANKLEGEREKLLAIPAPFVTRDVESRIDPGLSLPNAKSVVVAALPYAPSPTSNLSSLAYGLDYHVDLRAILEEEATKYRDKHKCNCYIQVDSGSLAERAFAVKAGLGFWGRNGMVISPKFGSYFNIGLLVVDAILPYSKPLDSLESKCPDDCHLCLEACPRDAIGKPMDCISYHTQKKAKPSRDEICGQLYGCDICQVVCPFNATAKQNKISLNNILDMTEADFNVKYGHTAMAWRGHKHLLRNAQV